MLVELTIRDLALIEEAEITLGRGLNVLTGETGAGKSLLVGALEILLGETPRGGAGAWVRKGTREARVEGRFEVEEPLLLESCRSVLRSELPAIAEEWEETLRGERGELVLGRTLSADGRTRAHVLHRPVPVRSLRAIAGILLEIHGQNDHQGLLVPSQQLRLLDLFGDLGAALARYQEARERWHELERRLRSFEESRVERHERALLLRFQRDELERAGLRPGERQALCEERECLRNAGEVSGELHAWRSELVEAEGSALERLSAVRGRLERWRERLSRLSAPLEDLRAAEIHVQEAATVLASLQDEVVDDPRRLEEVEERLAELERLEHKYRANEQGLLELRARTKDELAELEGSEEGLEALQGECARAWNELEEAGQALSSERRRLAPGLTRDVEQTLAALGLARARFAIGFLPRSPGDPRERFGECGTEDVEFLLAANPGEDLMPLRRVVSGGEAARIMLALRTVLGAGDSGRTLVFDEIDAGVGGRLGPEVGAHLREVAQRNQVLCVTHLPAIAALAPLHLRITKEVRKGRTRTRIEPLEGDARVAEVADMIAGGARHETARAEARRLIEEAAR